MTVLQLRRRQWWCGCGSWTRASFVVASLTHSRTFYKTAEPTAAASSPLHHTRPHNTRPGKFVSLPDRTLQLPTTRSFSTARFLLCAATMDKRQKWPGAVVRKTFLEYFEKHGHTIGT